MKITKLELFRVAPRWQFLKIETDAGLAGWGEPIVEGRAETTATAVRELSDYLIGRDPRQIEDLFQVMYRGGFYRGGPVLSSAISGIEQALWDIKGKALGVSVHELMGGSVRDKVRLYAHVRGDTPEACAADARKAVASGYTVLKMSVTTEADWVERPSSIDAAVGKFAAVREAVGRDVGVGIDFHGRVRRPVAKVLAKAIEPLDPMFYEELLLPGNTDALKEVANSCAVPLATGERMFTRWDFKAVLEAGVVDIIQPDVSHAGGIWELRKIAAMAEAYDVAVAPHCPLGPITLAASLQIDFCTPNAFIQEQSTNVAYHGDDNAMFRYLKGNPFAFEAGFVARSDAPGLGIEIDEEAVREAAVTGHRWRNPIFRLEDGSLAEW
ncbi:galactonate dehydratase [Burkholderia sp. Nafp2/4-1b]|uniref:galactonate dehydratase n=1 Tax=Burkholderia sp. Nafp2/4-1b TaxID=2116686 RepID=UPI000EF953E5|nr:galactonate dehydratase [Burkholderia sp. Nafp2/4-1b]RKU00069.1 galactonate dehydratase [Burkholderia sp. Nafp2/4-1b]